MIKRGKFIVIEGIDGCGKSTQMELLEKRLRKRKSSIVFTQEHTRGGVAGRAIERVVHRKSKLPPLALQFLFVADRIDHLKKVVEPALKEGKTVISDRYSWSTIAYGSLVADTEWLWQLHRYCLAPDLVILIDVPARAAVERIFDGREDLTIFEKRKKLRRIRKTYLWLANKFKDSSVIINGVGGPTKIHEQIYQVVKKWTKFSN